MLSKISQTGSVRLATDTLEDLQDSLGALGWSVPCTHSQFGQVQLNPIGVVSPHNFPNKDLDLPVQSDLDLQLRPHHVTGEEGRRL